jgi:hypothetical protein
VLGRVEEDNGAEERGTRYCGESWGAHCEGVRHALAPTNVRATVNLAGALTNSFLQT